MVPYNDSTAGVYDLMVRIAKRILEEDGEWTSNSDSQAS